MTPIPSVIDHLMDCDDLPDCVSVTRVFGAWRPGQVYRLDRAARAYRSACGRWVVMPFIVRQRLGDQFRAVVPPAADDPEQAPRGEWGTVHQPELTLSEAP